MIGVAEGQGLEERGLEDAKDEDAGAHAKREHGGSKNGERRVAAKATKGLPKLGTEGVKNGAAPNVANLFLEAFHAADFDRRFASRRNRVSASAYPFVFEQFTVRKNFRVEISLDSFPASEIAPEGVELRPERHTPPRRDTLRLT